MRKRLSLDREAGAAITEVIVALLALIPFLIGIPLLGKQLDIKHKAYDAARYSVWERTVWSEGAGRNRKPTQHIAIETRDRALGDPRAAVVPVDALHTDGVTENRLWRDAANRRLLAYAGDSSPIVVEQRSEREPVTIGSLLVPAFSYGGGIISAAASALRVHDLGMDERTFASANARINLRPILQARARTPVSLARTNVNESDDPALEQAAAAAILSDAWSARDETEFRQRVDALTTNEFVESIELPSRVLALNAIGKGEPLFGEGQYAWEVDLRPSSAILPRAYVERQR